MDAVAQRLTGRARPLDLLPWLGPPLVALLIAAPATVPLPDLDGLVGLGVALAVGTLVYRRPVLGMKLILVLLPVQGAVVAALYRLGLPAGTLRLFGYWKELVVVAMAAAAVRIGRTTGRRLDLVDALAVGFVALGTVYLLVPQLVVFDRFGLERSAFERLAAWRTDVLFVGLFLAVRHLRPTGAQVRSVLTTALRVGIVLAAAGVFELLASDLWNTFAVDILQLQAARADVLEVAPLGSRPDDIRVYGTVGGAEIVRVGGPLFDYLGYSFLMAATVAVAAEHLIRGAWRRAFLLFLLAGAALLATQTRSAVVAGGVAFALVLLPRRGVPVAVRTRFAVVAAALLLVAVALALATGLSDRFTAGDPSSDLAHTTSVEMGLDIVTESPLGRGLATGAGAAQTRQLGGTAIIENQYLTTASQLGIPAMVLQAAFLLALVARFHRLARRSTGTVALAAGAARGALVAVILVGWYLLPFASLPLAWTVMVLAGLALGLADGVDRDGPAGPGAATGRGVRGGYGGSAGAHTGRG